MVRRAYTLLVIGSMHSVLPRTCDVLAVGISAMLRLFRSPCFCIRAFRAFQSHSVMGFSFHKSYCNRPRLAGEPS